MRPDQDPPHIQKDLFGGNGAVRVWDLLGRSAAPPFAAALWCELDPGGRVGPHRQEHFPEILIGIEGEGEARVDGALRRLSLGSVVYLALGQVLEIRNLSAERPLRYVIVKARAE